jgi:hypothetical protein
MYSNDRLLKLEGRKDLGDLMVQAISLGDPQGPGNKTENQDEKKSKLNPTPVAPINRNKSVDGRLPAYYVRSRSATKLQERGVGGYVSPNNFLENKSETNTSKNVSKAGTGKSILRIIFVERFDLIIAASEDKDIYVWGFDLEALTALQHQADVGSVLTEGIHISLLLLKIRTVPFLIIYKVPESLIVWLALHYVKYLVIIKNLLHHWHL